MRRRRLLSVFSVLLIIVGLMSITPSAQAFVCDATHCYYGNHTDVLARFASGRTIVARAAVQENRSTLEVRAYMELWATGTSGNRVPAIYTVQDFHLKRYLCSAVNVCNPVQPPYTKCSTACEIRTTSSNPTAVIVSSVGRPGDLYDAWRTVADQVDGVILNTTDNITGTKCVSSYRVQHAPGFSESSPPTC